MTVMAADMPRIDHVDDVRQHLTLTAAAMTRSVSHVAPGIRDLMVRRLASVENDSALRDLLLTSVRATALGITRQLESGVASDAETPPAALVECTRRLAQRGVPIHEWLRAYACGQQPLLRWALEAAVSIGGAPDVRTGACEQILDEVFDYTDRMSELITELYEEERAAWLAGHSQRRADQVRRLLDGEADDVTAAEGIIGYSLQTHHVGIVASIAGPTAHADQLSVLTQAIRKFADEMGGRRPLIVSCDSATVWAWVAVPSTWHFDPRLTHWQPGGRTQLSLAIGSSQRGVDGFRRTHDEAQRAHLLAAFGGTARGRVVLSHDEPGLAATTLLSQDLEGARCWIRGVLGDLAHDDKDAARLRETLLNWLQHDMRYTTTADTLVVHKNTVRYRLQSAETLIGRPIAENRIDVHLALIACDWLGPSVLT